MEKYFMHRIQEIDGAVQKGIEVHDTLESAILSFWGRMKTAYNNPQYPNTTFVSCKITDGNGNTVSPYDMTWKKEESEDNKFFFHHIRRDGESISKDIDVCSTFDDARYAYAAAMEYGYNNPRFPNVDFVSCEITDQGGIVLKPFAETWVKTVDEPAAE